VRSLLAAAALAAMPFAKAADITVLASPAIREAYAELVPLFERSSGHKVATTWAGTVDIMKRMQAREAFDVVIAASNSLDELIDTGRLMAGSRTDLARSSVGVTVRAGAARPDIGSADAVKRALVAAKSVGISTGPSGVYMNALFERLGIAEQMKPKLKVVPPGAQVAELVAKGEIELGFQQVSELVHASGADYVGPLPPEIQSITVFSGGVHAASQEPDAARALLRFLGSAEHANLLQKHGLEPGAAAPY
jgi:molybdate transport system substrate-binding protein